MIARPMTRWTATAAAALAAGCSLGMAGYFAAMSAGLVRVPAALMRFEVAIWWLLAAVVVWWVILLARSGRG